MAAPKLRFKNDLGQDYTEWKYPKLSDIFEYITDKKHPMDEVLTIKQGIGTVPRKESGIDIKYDPQSLSNYKQVQKDDFIIHLRSFQAGFEIANEKGIVSPAYTILRKKTTIAIPFYRAYFQTNSFINHNLNIVVEGIRDGRTINITDLKNRPIPYPILPEQQKIADFLSTYDRQIDIQSQRVEAMRTRKKGLLQKIFSQEIRFKDDEGKDYPEWDEKKIGEFSQCIAGATPSTKEPRYWENGNIPWMSSGEVNNRIICSTEKKISSLGYENSSTKMLPENTVVIALAGQGKTRGMVAITRIRLCTNQSLCGIVTDSSILSDYLYQFLLTQYEYLRLISSGDGTRGGLN